MVKLNQNLKYLVPLVIFLTVLSLNQALAITESSLYIPFYSRLESQFSIAKIYYVATNEPGASNDNNGLYPTYQGGNNGPFKDLNTENIRNLLSGNQGVKMVLRQGTYYIAALGDLSPSGNSGITLNGSGDEFHPVILTSYPGETAILDGGENLPWDQIHRIATGQESYQIRIRQLIDVLGQNNIVENLTIRYGFRHNIQIAGRSSIIRNNTLIGVYEDSIKILSSANNVYIYNNNVYGFGSQGVDYFGGDNIIIEKNDFHDPGLDPTTDQIEANAITSKGGVNGLLIRNNQIHDFDTNLTPAIGLGSGSSAPSFHERDQFGNYLPSASNVLVVDNTIYNYRGPAFLFVSCDTCGVEGNKIYNTLGLSLIGYPQPELYFESPADQLPPSRNININNNQFAGNNGNLSSVCSSRNSIIVGMTCYVYSVATTIELNGFVSSNNTYYTDTPPNFVYLSNSSSHQQFILSVNTDSSSQIRPRNEFISPTVLVGDLNNDLIVNSIDYSILNSDWFTSNSRSDLNSDGLVNAIDYSLLNANWFKTY
ncbi:MAG: hypothetical protein A3I07_02625 [Candidatus Doudnabacteria bacterium RIFCSPLOWO2_02_FULL_42_9]|uniref:Dockerin domain-containing protein n=1 Tax=Candidatus Doudnabacteria bacterium RIFCSPHIGHO2_01_FULL_41_86 TaxID=1817821 RepID=A0A1F5N9Q0_9BACT|nr:MAG: hypothetical protein A2717_02155 [Candidatus Doudnabacteria bacterium RIFCSPHIGHO2_01_FULL_41_86]OGE75567.1 MAG: hypothetical protein A3K07_01910 [Candidatus Doudnabacteria bacterium RIFCSPHIGHO2_01_43_10]OGE85363.1 MAG: hypothetical protein A3E28_01725 [Candidatus Doudnabacteria bacterium RIFCSPHIGHO2_12_FULL_42_22]OGE86901.1 MAG: hypothetical protein A3C49_02560 [Candidatus Doudnabacteria bacterium RIFCSPHIGHO2_02_FULL_42_25]OGE92500.1 MAG: hypothetical protein A2895_02715 [Candidatus